MYLLAIMLLSHKNPCQKYHVGPGNILHIVRVCIWRTIETTLGSKFVYEYIYNLIIAVNHIVGFVLFCFLLFFKMSLSFLLNIVNPNWQNCSFWQSSSVGSQGSFNSICHFKKIIGKTFCFWQKADAEACLPSPLLLLQMLCTSNQINNICLQHYCN